MTRPGQATRDLAAAVRTLQPAPGGLREAVVVQLQPTGYCAFCGRPCAGYACRCHRDLIALDPHVMLR